MIHPQLFTLIPIVVAIVWASYTKWQTKKFFDMTAFIAVGVVLVLNALIMYQYMNDYGIPLWLHFLQLVLSSCIIPTVYMYFSLQMGTSWDSRAAVQMWLLLLILLIPNGTILLDGIPERGATATLYGDELRNLRIHFVYGGHVVKALTTADIVMILQSLIVSIRLVYLVRSMHKYNLRLQTRAKAVAIWGGATCAFIITVSFTFIEQLSQPLFSWCYFLIYSIFTTGAFVMLALGYDLSPIVTTEGEENVDIDSFIKVSRNMAERFRIIMEDEERYKQIGLTVDDVVRQLGTNRTYFARMMNIEFGMTFSQYLAQKRTALAKDLIINTGHTFSTIATMCGFADASSFGRFFKENTGATPGAWRKENQHKTEAESPS